MERGVVEEHKDTYIIQGINEINEEAIEAIVDKGSASSVIGRKELEAILINVSENEIIKLKEREELTKKTIKFRESIY